MKVKALWGFAGSLGHVRTGDVIEVSKEYGHALIGKGLAVEVDESEANLEAPSSNKQAKPKEAK